MINKQITSIIFDMDGVISDTQKNHSQIESQLLSENGVNITPEKITQRYSGVHTKEFFTSLLPEDIDIAKILSEKWEIMEKMTRVSGINEIQGSVELIKSLSKKYSLGVASASPLSFIKIVLHSLQIESYFDIITSAEEVTKGKPEPDIFLLAAKRLGTDPKQCLVIEDGISGMIGAKNAGMFCIGLVSTTSGDTDYPADIVITKLNQIKI